jgi:hypothetical protein
MHQDLSRRSCREVGDDEKSCGRRLMSASPRETKIRALSMYLQCEVKSLAVLEQELEIPPLVEIENLGRNAILAEAREALLIFDKFEPLCGGVSMALLRILFIGFVLIPG